MTEAHLSKPISFQFAKRYGVLFMGVDNDHAKIIYRDQPALQIFSELRRHLQLPLHLEKVDDETFGKLLVKHYETDSNTAMLIAEDLGESLNLTDLIHQLPSQKIC